MRKIVIIGANHFQEPLIFKCKQMGFETHVFAWEDGAVGKKYADYFYPISIVEKGKILEKCKKIKPNAVATIASDLAQTTANFLCRNLNLPCNGNHSTLISSNKFEMRKALNQAGLKTPCFFKTSGVYGMEGLSFPCIVKPTDRSGSRAVTKVMRREDLDEAVSRAVESSFENQAIVEEYIEGDEYSCECISFGGEHHFLAVTKKFTTGAPNFIETAQLQPSGLNAATEQRVAKEIFKALDALEIKFGASHSEFKLDSMGNVRIIEIGARMGGDCIGSHLVQMSTGYDFLKMVIDVACGTKPILTAGKERNVAMIRFLFNRNDIDHMNKICRLFPQNVAFKSDIDSEVHQVTDSSTRLGHYILKCENMDKLNEILNITQVQTVKIKPHIPN